MVKYYLLTGDIGGTNSRMAFYDTSGTGKCQPMLERHYRNAEHILPEHYKDPNIFTNQIIIPFLKYCFAEIKNLNSASADDDVHIIATLAVAGMVLNNQVRLTNLGSMLIDGNAIMNNNEHEILRKIVVCRIINDFVAQGYGCLTLKQHEVRRLYGPCTNVEQLPIGPKVCIGAGTGLGECYLTPDKNAASYSCYASEGGHVEYAPRNDVEIQMFRFLMKKFDSRDRISVERVVSGKGLANVYDFLSSAYPSQINQAVHDQFLAAGDEQGKIVGINTSKCTLCRQAMSIMISAYGCETGSAAIKFIPIGGIFVTGGLTPKNIQYIDGSDSEFMKAYLNKGRVSPLLEHVPLFAVMVEDLGVRGAHKAAYTEYESYIQTSTIGDYVPKQKRFYDQVMLGTIAALTLAVGALTILRRK